MIVFLKAPSGAFFYGSLVLWFFGLFLQQTMTTILIRFWVLFRPRSKGEVAGLLENGFVIRQSLIPLGKIARLHCITRIYATLLWSQALLDLMPSRPVWQWFNTYAWRSQFMLHALSLHSLALMRVHCLRSSGPTSEGTYPPMSRSRISAHKKSQQLSW